ncbi:MAG: hypothetical protein ABR613_11665 [Actinomycetota bacterium]
MTNQDLSDTGRGISRGIVLVLAVFGGLVLLYVAVVVVLFLFAFSGAQWG